MVVAFSLSMVFFLAVMARNSTVPANIANLIDGALYALACASISFAFLATFVRFATRRRWIYESVSENEYGMYLVHYMFVSWLQLAVLSAPLFALEKGMLVATGTLLLSWGASVAIRTIPGVSRIV